MTILEPGDLLTAVAQCSTRSMRECLTSLATPRPPESAAEFVPLTTYLRFGARNQR
jgi:hypothetical protein